MGIEIVVICGISRRNLPEESVFYCSLYKSAIPGGLKHFLQCFFYFFQRPTGREVISSGFKGLLREIPIQKGRFLNYVRQKSPENNFFIVESLDFNFNTSKRL